MSTNYYIEGPNGKEHIGKYSGGWVFGFQGQNHETVAAWRKRLDALGQKEMIVNERGHDMNPADFWAMVKESTEPWGPNKIMPQSTMRMSNDLTWNDEGFPFSNYDFS